MSSKVSVIIPVYNAEGTIGNILDKLITQKYKNIEIIAVNDGSKDGSLKILEEFSKSDERVMVINQENAGVSAARNAGISRATGEFIIFIDSDDDFSEDIVVKLIEASSDGIDFVMCSMSINGRDIVTRSAVVKGRESIVCHVLRSLLTKNLYYGPYCKLFRSNIIREYNIRFPEQISYGEDTIFVLDYLRQVEGMALLDRPLYFYKFLPTGLAASNVKNLHFRRARVDALGRFVQGRLSLANFILNLLVRARWSAAYLKNRVGI